MKLKQEKIQQDIEKEHEFVEVEKKKLTEKDNEKFEKIIKDRLNRLKFLEKDNIEFEVENNINRPLRGYLLENVVPTITEALIESCKVLPEDPIDFLAE